MAENSQAGFTEAQIKELQTISQLQGEEKSQRLTRFLSGLTEEQKKLLQTRSCVYCAIVAGAMQSYKLYEDATVVCVLDVKPATKGHLVIVPKQHFFVSSQMDINTSSHVFTVANTFAKVVYDVLGADGTNIFVANGAAAGQQVEHFVVHVIPRYKDDGLSFGWEGKQTEAKDMEVMYEKLKAGVNKAFGIEEPILKKEATSLKKDTVEEAHEDDASELTP
jgi:histidine triad (HIT) family protein